MITGNSPQLLNSTQFLNLNLLKQTSVIPKPFPHLTMSSFILPEYFSVLIADFPDISHRGSIPANSVKTSPAFQQFIAELEGDALKQILAEKFALDLQDKPSMLTLRGYTT